MRLQIVKMTRAEDEVGGERSFNKRESAHSLMGSMDVFQSSCLLEGEMKVTQHCTG